MNAVGYSGRLVILNNFAPRFAPHETRGNAIYNLDHASQSNSARFFRSRRILPFWVTFVIGVTVTGFAQEQPASAESLVKVVQRGDLATLRARLSTGTNPNEPDDFAINVKGWTPLMAAALSGNLEMLLSHFTRIRSRTRPEDGIWKNGLRRSGPGRQAAGGRSLALRINLRSTELLGTTGVNREVPGGTESRAHSAVSSCRINKLRDGIPNSPDYTAAIGWRIISKSRNRSRDRWQKVVLAANENFMPIKGEPVAAGDKIIYLYRPNNQYFATIVLPGPFKCLVGEPPITERWKNGDSAAFEYVCVLQAGGYFTKLKTSYEDLVKQGEVIHVAADRVYVGWEQGLPEAGNGTRFWRFLRGNP